MIIFKMIIFGKVVNCSYPNGVIIKHLRTNKKPLLWIQI